jgi:hypothetical protein
MPRRSRSRERHSRVQHGSKVRSPARCRTCRDYSPGPVARHLGSHRRRDSHPRTHKERVSSTGMGAVIVAGLDQLMAKYDAKRSVGMSMFVLSNIVGEFNPLESNVVDWLNAVDEYAVIYNWDDQLTSHLALSKLRGPAEVWYRGLPTRLFTWREWRDMLLTNFQPKRDLYRDLKEMMNCVPLPLESLYEYVYRKLAFVHKLKIPLTGEEQVNLILGGITDERIRFSVDTANITDPHVLANHFMLMSDQKNTQTKYNPIASKQSREYRVTTERKNANLDGGTRNTDETITSAAPTSSNRNTSGSEINCFYCHKRGHIRRECPDRMSRKTNLQGETKSKFLALEYKNVNFIGSGNVSKKYFKTITLDDHEVLSFVDLGSQL